MHKHLEYRDTTHVDVFYLLRSDVFSLCQLEDVLFPINDAQSPILTKTSVLTQTHLTHTG